MIVATGEAVLRIDPARGSVREADLAGASLPTCLAADPGVPGRAWCGTRNDGVLRSDDGGRSWEPAGLEGESVTAVAVGPAARTRGAGRASGPVRVGTEPSAVWRPDAAGSGWRRIPGLRELPSSSGWSFPPRPETDHVRWIAFHPHDPDRLWIAIEAGALVRTTDGGRTWIDRVPGGPLDTHELAADPDLPETLRVAAGDGYFESRDGGETWRSPDEGLGVGYLRSVAIDPAEPETVVVSGASRPRSAYVAGSSDGRLHRREGTGRWERVRQGWPDPPATIAPLLTAGPGGGLWAADERGVHRSEDGGRSWRRVASFEPPPRNLRGLVTTPG